MAGKIWEGMLYTWLCKIFSALSRAVVLAMMVLLTDHLHKGRRLIKQSGPSAGDICRFYEKLYKNEIKPRPVGISQLFRQRPYHRALRFSDSKVAKYLTTSEYFPSWQNSHCHLANDWTYVEHKLSLSQDKVVNWRVNWPNMLHVCCSTPSIYGGIFILKN